MADAKIWPFLMFEGNAETAMNFYVSLFPGAEILETVRYGPDEAKVAGLVKKATFRIGDQTILCSDSTVKHEFSFTPAFSIFVACSSEDEISQLYSALAAEGTTLMPMGEYGFSRRFAWVKDLYGVSWQLNLA